MIPRDYITEWRREAPWVQDAQVEQDLVISRALVQIYSHPVLSETLAFRGGTALYKLYLHPAAQYSEDIDLVQIRSEPIGPTLDALRTVLDPWLGLPHRKQNEGRVTLIYVFDSEDIPPLKLRLKIEINSREHFSVLGLKKVPFGVTSRWFAGEAMLTTFCLDELLATKLRALYQRKKGRDLFDLDRSLSSDGLDPAAIIKCFEEYMAAEGSKVTRAIMERNLAAKMMDPLFTADISPLLAQGISWDLQAAYQRVCESLVALLQGAAWKGELRD